MNKPLVLTLALLSVLAACSDQDSEEPLAQNTAQAEPRVELPRTPSAEGARIFFISPTDGETVSSPVSVEFGIAGMTVAPAGDMTPQSGHHHLLIDTGLPDLGLPIPKDANHVHFGDGSTSTEISLEPGEHTLQMLLGDHLHIPHEPPLTSDQITVIVE